MSSAILENVISTWCMETHNILYTSFQLMRSIASFPRLPWSIYCCPMTCHFCQRKTLKHNAFCVNNACITYILSFRPLKNLKKIAAVSQLQLSSFDVTIFKIRNRWTNEHAFPKSAFPLMDTSAWTKGSWHGNWRSRRDIRGVQQQIKITEFMASFLPKNRVFLTLRERVARLL